MLTLTVPTRLQLDSPDIAKGSGNGHRRRITPTMGCLCANGRAWQNNLSVWRVNTVLKSGGHEASLLIVLRQISHYLSHVGTVSHQSNVEVTKLLHF